MKSIKSWHDLGKYGIKYLTGEQDPYCLRVTVDLTEEGKEIIRIFLNLKSADFWNNWNSGSTGSMMLPYVIFKDLSKFIMFHIEKVRYVVITNFDEVIEIDETYYERYLEGMKLYHEMGVRVFENPHYHPDQEPKNTNLHHFTGRYV